MFFCADCLRLVSLDSHGRCEVCGSDAVAQAERGRLQSSESGFTDCRRSGEDAAAGYNRRKSVEYLSEVQLREIAERHYVRGR